MLTTKLTRREQSIVDLIKRGRIYRQIGQELGIQLKTVQTHATSIHRKLRLKPYVSLRVALKAGDHV